MIGSVLLYTNIRSVSDRIMSVSDVKETFIIGGNSMSDTAIFIMVVSPAVLAHDLSARASDVSMGIAVFPIDWIYSVPFEKLGDG